MIVDHRTYTLHPGTLKDYVERYEREGLPIQSKYLGPPLGWYTSMDVGMLNQVVHLWAYESVEDRASRRTALAADPEWQAFLKVQLKMVQTMENKLLSPTGFMARR